MAAKCKIELQPQPDFLKHNGGWEDSNMLLCIVQLIRIKECTQITIHLNLITYVAKTKNFNKLLNIDEYFCSLVVV